MAVPRAWRGLRPEPAGGRATHAGGGADPGIDWRFIAPRALVGLLAAYLVFRVGALVVTHHVNSLWLKDYALYIGATQRWLAGGSFYLPSQLAGPHPLEWGLILYPP